MADRDAPTFLTLIDQLTRPHPRTVLREHGSEIRTQDGLLQQLRQAVFVGLETGGVGAAFGSKMPMDASAADLLDEIDTQAAEVLAAVSHTPTPFGTTESYVRLWSGQTSEHKLFTVTVRRQMHNAKAYLEVFAEANPGKKLPPVVETTMTSVSAIDLVQGWVNRITDLFNPPSTREIRAKCPACEARYSYKLQDGEHHRSAAMSFIRDRDGRTVSARCAVCTASWAPPQFDWLAGAIGLTVGDLASYLEDDKPKRPWGEPTDLPEGSYRLNDDGVWADVIMGTSFPDTPVNTG